jgi:peptide deformylase
MAKLKIVKIGDSTLRKVCRPVDKITPRTLTLLDDMVETMRGANGCGLAAPQVGVLRRIVVVETEPGEVIELINPKIIAFSGEQREEEGCLSVPGRAGIT